jgi:hypothetical protein
MQSFSAFLTENQVLPKIQGVKNLSQLQSRGPLLLRYLHLPLLIHLKEASTRLTALLMSGSSSSVNHLSLLLI